MDFLYILYSYVLSFENLSFSFIVLITFYTILFFISYKTVNTLSIFKSYKKVKALPIPLKSEYIYRLEMNNLGPYKHKKINGKKNYFYKKTETENSPAPYNEWGDLYNFLVWKKQMKNYRFGFFDKKDLYKWFDENEVKILKDYGFELNLYKSNSFIPGKKQVMFEYNESLLIEKNIEY